MIDLTKWGKSIHTYWGGDTKDLEIGQSIDDAKEEEELAKDIVRQQLSQLDDDAFALDGEHFLTGDATVAKGFDTILALGGNARSDDSMYGAMASLLCPQSNSLEMIKENATSLSELNAFRPKLKEAVRDLSSKVWPALEALRGSDPRGSMKAMRVYLLLKEQLLLGFVANLGFYLLLISERNAISKHILPKIVNFEKRIDALKSFNLTRIKLRKLDNECPNRKFSQIQPSRDHQDDGDCDAHEDEANNSSSSKTLRSLKDTEPVSFLLNTRHPKKKHNLNAIGHYDSNYLTVYSGKLGGTEHGVSATNSLHTYEIVAKSQSAIRANKKAKYAVAPCFGTWQDNVVGLKNFKSGRRSASKVIINNMGMTVHTPQKNRNPRIKKKLKYANALIRRKGQIRDSFVVKSSYVGEGSGIRSCISRSRHMVHHKANA